MEHDDGEPDEEPICDLCGLPLELKPIDVDGHPAVELVCLVHERRQLWEPFADR